MKRSLCSKDCLGVTSQRWQVQSESFCHNCMTPRGRRSTCQINVGIQAPTLYYSLRNIIEARIAGSYQFADSWNHERVMLLWSCRPVSSGSCKRYKSRISDYLNLYLLRHFTKTIQRSLQWQKYLRWLRTDLA